MYIIEFEKGVYATKGSGDPARTLKVENAQRFSDWMKARLKLDKVLEEIKAFRKFPNAKVKWVDEVTGALGDSLHETSGLNIPRVSKTKRSEVAVCDHSHGFYFDDKGIITCVRCYPLKKKQTDC